MVVPEEYQEEMLKMYHITPMGNHRNAGDLTRKILKTHYWKGLHGKARKFVATCQVCIRVKGRLKRMPRMQQICRTLPGRVAIDTIGPIEGAMMPYIMVLTMLAIGWSMAKAYKKCNSRNAADILLSFILKFGMPSSVLCDQGSEFMNRTFDYIKRRLGFAVLYITSKNKTANGQAENKNRAVNAGIMAQMLQNAGSVHKMHEHLEAVMFALNNVEADGRKSYNELLYGWKPTLIPELAEPEAEPDDTKKQTKNKLEVKARLDKIKQMRDLYMVLTSEKRFEKNFRYNEKLGQRDRYAVGDLVWLYREENLAEHDVTKKYEVKKVGPMTIISRSKWSDAYVIADTKSGYLNRVHSKYLSAYGTFRPLPDFDPVSDDEEAEDRDINADQEDSSSEDDDDQQDGNVDKRNITSGKRNRRAAHHGPYASLAKTESSELEKRGKV